MILINKQEYYIHSKISTESGGADSTESYARVVLNGVDWTGWCGCDAGQLYYV